MNRKHWMIISAAVLLFVGAAVSVAGPPRKYTVGTNSVMVLPPRGRLSAPDYAADTSYNVNDIVKSGSAYWFCTVTNGLSVSNSLAGLWTASDGSNTWHRIATGKRNGFMLINDGTNTVYGSFYSAAELNKGFRLNANGGSLDDFTGGYQGAIYAICSGASNNVGAVEW